MFKLKEIKYLLDNDYIELVDIASDGEYTSWDTALTLEHAVEKYRECNVLRIERSYYAEDSSLDIILEDTKMRYEYKITTRNIEDNQKLEYFVQAPDEIGAVAALNEQDGFNRAYEYIQKIECKKRKAQRSPENESFIDGIKFGVLVCVLGLVCVASLSVLVIGLLI